MIKIRELSKHLNCGKVVSLSRIICASKIPKKFALLLRTDSGNPRIVRAPLAECDALEPGRGSLIRLLVALVLLVVGKAEVAFSAIKSVSILVVNNLAGLRVHDDPVKSIEDVSLSDFVPSISNCVVRPWCMLYFPRMGIYARQILGINDGNVALGQFNFNHNHIIGYMAAP